VVNYGVIGRRRTVTVLVVAFAVVAAACGADDPDPRSIRPDRSTRATTTTVAPTTVPPTEPPTTAPPPTEPPPPPTAPPAANPLAPYGEVVRGNPDRPEMSLTFDCGSGSAPTPAILQTLRNRGIRTTFSLTGRWVEQNPGLTQEIAAEHELSNHSYSHSDFAAMSDAEILDEMHRTEAIIEQTAGRGTKPLWRAPYGSRNQHILELVSGAGWPTHLFWTVDALDWQQISPDEVKARVLNVAGNGAIALMHCASPQTAEVLDSLITDIQARGLTLTSVSALLR
jgi:peptidoglycan/xylan/chitin deacetylase (PgdA/CDA1 family)